MSPLARPPISVRALSSCLAMLLAGFAVDVSLGPILLRQWATLDFLAVAVALGGLRHGPWIGLGLGWVAGAMLAACTGEPTAIAAFALGTMGFVAGLVRRAAAIGLPPLDVLLIFGLLILKHGLANLAAMVLLGAAPDTAFGGIVLTTLAAGIRIWYRPIAAAARPARQIVP